MSLVVRRRLGRLFGLVAILVGAAMFTSYENRAFLGRYSVVYAVVLMLVVLVTMIAVALSIWNPRRDGADRTLAGLTETAWITLGLAYLTSALYDPMYGGRLLEANLFGSPFLVPAALEYATLCLVLCALLLFAARRVTGMVANLLLALGAVAVVALLGEGYARGSAFVRAHTFGIPSYAGEIFHHRYVHLNSAGFRDVERQLAAAPGVRRLLLVGDSMAFGAGIRRTEDRFGEQLQAELTRLDGAPWEVINASHGDRNTLQEMQYLEWGLAYRPEVVLLLYVFNDADYIPVAERGPRTSDGAIFEHPRSLLHRVHPMRVAYRNSFLFQELYARWRLVRMRWFFDTGPRDVYRTPEALSKHLADVARFVRMSGSSGAMTTIVPIDPAVPGDSSATDRYRAFANAATAAGLPVMSIAEVYRGRDIKDITVSALDAHVNALGYRLAVTDVAPRILAALRSRTPATVKAP